MTQTLPLTMILGATHTGKAIGYRVLNLNRTVYSAFTTTGVGESATIPGTYYVSGGISAPDAGGHIVVGTAIEDLREQTIESALLVDKAGFRDAFGMAAADMDAQLAALPANIDTQLSITHGAGAWGPGGTGSFSQVYTITVNGLPAAGVYCRMTTDLAGLANVSAGTTNAAGQVTFTHDLPSGTTVYIWRVKAGVEFDDPDVEVIP